MVSIKLAFDLLALFLANFAAYHLMASLQTADAMLAIRPGSQSAKRFVWLLTVINASSLVCFLLAAVAVWFKWQIAAGLVGTPLLILLYSVIDSKTTKKTGRPLLETP
jgi:ABC-type transport system involved in cytochrome bd biosynthesis fused ATPase/permease subunit